MAIVLLLGCESPRSTPKSNSKTLGEVTIKDGDSGIHSFLDAGAKNEHDGDKADLKAGNDKERDGFEHQVDVARPPKRPKKFPAVARPTFPVPSPQAMVKIPAGTLLVGSSPIDTLRDQFAENDLIPHEMTGFEIDALPFPGDAARPFLTGVSYAEAEQHCVSQGKRLCTELEWEYACKSEDNRRYPIGNYYDKEAYVDSKQFLPPSPTGVFAMGRLLEWTSSKWGMDEMQTQRTAIRGFAPGQFFKEQVVQPEQGRRCAKRWHRENTVQDANLGFRCCKGPVNKGHCFIERPRPPFSQYSNMKPDKFAKVIRSIPELSMVHDNPHMFSDADVRSVLARRNLDRKQLAKEGIRFFYKPQRWIPRQGMELWVAVGRSNKHSFIVALHETKDNEEYALASSMILYNQPQPLALVQREGYRDELYWAPCWRCRNGGSVAYDEKTNEVIITHRW